jgi:hypothetical protein
MTATGMNLTGGNSMRFHNIIGAFLLVILVKPFFVHAGTVNVPNSFQAGKKAVASEVNANFNAVEAAINDNAQDIQQNASDISQNAQDIQQNATDISTNATNIQANSDAISAISGRLIVKDNNGTIAGRFIDYRYPDAILVISSEGYIFEVESSSGIIGATSDEFFTPSYQSDNCSGQAYWARNQTTIYSNGFVAARADGALYYYPPNTTPSGAIEIASKYYIRDSDIGPECVNLTDYPGSFTTTFY